MTETLRKHVELPESPETVWRAITESDTISEWMYPNDFRPVVGHRFTLSPPPNPQANFDGTVHCEVRKCEPPNALSYSWAGGPVVGTRVSIVLEPSQDGGTLLHLEHSGFDLTQPWGESARHGADHGWKLMLQKLTRVLEKHN